MQEKMAIFTSRQDGKHHQNEFAEHLKNRFIMVMNFIKIIKYGV